jgi:Na+-transporting NADH:ubiquinone oxidoreductase subunit A
MSNTIKLKKGFNINLAGKAQTQVAAEIMPKTVALKPTDFHGLLRPKPLVQEGDLVKVGTPILYDKAHETIKLTSPVSGEVTEIVRGAKRKLLEIRIKVDGAQTNESFNKLGANEILNAGRETLVEMLTAGGVWPYLVQRPYGILADPAETPKAIFISGFDSSPLAPDYAFILKGEERYFQAGLDALTVLTDGPVHLSLNADAEIAPVFAESKNVAIHKFSGKHPAGNVGVQIHHIDPINKGDIVWTINPVGVAKIGKLITEGYYDATKLVAIAGSQVKKPAYVKTVAGANVGDITQGNIKTGTNRFISGNVLTGTNVGADGYLGFFDSLITIILEGDEYEFLGWLKPDASRLSYHRALGLLSFLNPKKEFVLDTNTRGEERAFVQTGTFEDVTPMDIMPVYLLKAIMAEDYDGMEALGIYEVIEEDLALCEFIDISKHDVQAIIREGLTLMQFS